MSGNFLNSPRTLLANMLYERNSIRGEDAELSVICYTSKCELVDNPWCPLKAWSRGAKEQLIYSNLLVFAW